LRHHRVVIFGAGMAGKGIPDKISNPKVGDGRSPEDAAKRFWCVDRQGLLTTGMLDQLQDFQLTYVRSGDESKDWKHQAGGNGVGLAEVIHQVQPTMLIGASAAPDSFTEAMIRDMAAHTERPVVFVLSLPASQSEAKPADLIAWTDGRALVATGSSFSPVTYKGATYVIGQINNAMLYPGLALGAIVSRATRVSGAMFAAAANAVSSLVSVHQHGAALLPSIDDLRSVSITVAVAVAECADDEGLAGVKLENGTVQVRQAMWRPEYRKIQAS
jgi:malate dehydrogenase (oxaloacetate-decarboxylating)